MKNLIEMFPSRHEFFRWVKQYNETRPCRSTPAKEAYKKVIDGYRAANPTICLKDPTHLQSIHCALCTWGANRGVEGGALVSKEEFGDAVIREYRTLVALSEICLANMDDAELNRVVEQLRHLFHRMPIVRTTTRLVAISKTLHFLLPDLVPPVDSRVNKFLFGGKPRREPAEEFRRFEQVFRGYAALAQHLDLSMADVDRQGWNLSMSKLIDNAVIAKKDPSANRNCR